MNPASLYERNTKLLEVEQVQVPKGQPKNLVAKVHETLWQTTPQAVC